ncbi:serine hydrolase domain-containing protein [Parvularcula maris]|uniref:Beta-lactamase family protein n=1 Tax=Parvularcula maris TaxID=2965077 RepID=A0A9X2RJQ2_9PROT|nr:serine hydrolase domain-containing protein [Parvularcula maris]MCQ8186121.1 beta-lactamase family protein [Parvularcula maris]
MKGVLDLDETLAPFPYPRIEDKEAYAKITPRMVLTHRTGMPNWSGDSQDEYRGDPIPFETEPGEAYSYSGEAFELLRAYLVSKTGRSLHELFLPRFGSVMPNSSFDGRLRGRAVPSRAYEAASDPASGRDLYLKPHRTGAAWGLLTTAGDYAAFLAAVCRGEGLSETMRAEMLRPQSPIPPATTPAPASYGLGWVITQLGPETIVMHSGNNGEYRSLAAYLPATGEGYVILTNGRNGEDMIGAILEGAQP